MIRFKRTKTQKPRPSRRPTIADRMAEDIREMAFASQTVSAETLGQCGYSAAVVARLGSRAVAIARRRSIRQIAEV